MKEFLGDKVADVRLSNRLKSGAVCLVADAAGPSLAMEQAFAAANNPMLKARRILEINPQHELFSKLTAVHDQGKDSQSFKDYCNLLYDQALLMADLPLSDPSAYTKLVCKLMK